MVYKDKDDLKKGSKHGSDSSTSVCAGSSFRIRNRNRKPSIDHATGQSDNGTPVNPPVNPAVAAVDPAVDPAVTPMIPSVDPPPVSPQLVRADPSIHRDPSIVTSKPKIDEEHCEKPPEKWTVRCKKCIYDKEKRTILGRTCVSWRNITVYSILYLIFLLTFTLMFLFFSLIIIKSVSFPSDESTLDVISYLKYSPNTVELTGDPLSEHNYPLIWYRAGEENEYTKYVTALDEVFRKNRATRDWMSNLGPCGQRPYGYGERPCFLVKIDKQLNWVGKPLEAHSPKVKNLPDEVQKWIARDSKKYWLHCDGYHNYDKEHLGKIKYFPDPPGFDSSLYPLDENSTSPVIAFQVSNFTLGVSLIIECKLWFEDGFTSISFMLYVLPKRN